MRSRSRSPVARAIELMLVAFGSACLGWVAGTMVTIHQEQSVEQAAIERMLAARKPGAPIEVAPAAGLPSRPRQGAAVRGLVGRLDIPRLHLSASVMEGDSNRVLASAVGYLPDTPRPWQPGNSALAAHRDRLFRPLEHIRVGDDIQLATEHGDFQYRVRRTLIVEATDVWVLDAQPDVNLTLITCFPFGYIGHAPQRFVVQAEKIPHQDPHTASEPPLP